MTKARALKAHGESAPAQPRQPVTGVSSDLERGWTRGHGAVGDRWGNNTRSQGRSQHTVPPSSRPSYEHVTRHPQGTPFLDLSWEKAFMGESDTCQAGRNDPPGDLFQGPTIKQLPLASAPPPTYHTELLRDPEVTSDKAFWKL